MKKIFSLIAILVLLSGCDDGDMTFKTFDFSDANDPQNCPLASTSTGKLYYISNGTEVLILELADGQLINSENRDESGKNIPREIIITGNNKITYRNYTAIPSNICATFINGTADYDDQWIGVGTLSVITTATTDKDTGKVTGYGHQITLKNVTFTKGGESITINDNLYGTINIANGFDFKFAAADKEPTVLSCFNIIYTKYFKEALVLTIAKDSDLFKNEAGTRSVVVNNVDELVENRNTIDFTVFESTVNDERICKSGGGELPNPVPGQRWSANATTSQNTITPGTIKVITTFNAAGNSYLHKIYLKDIIFRNRDSNNLTFTLKDVAVETEDGYFFGEYSKAAE